MRTLRINNYLVPPSPWVEKFIGHIPARGTVLDLACGSGRHTHLLASAGHQVLAVDRDAAALAQLDSTRGITTCLADLEQDEWPLAGRRFAGIVVTNYLWRPRLAEVLGLLQPGGVLLYETFMAGQERFGKPSNPDFLLAPGELLQAARSAGLDVIAYEEGYGRRPAPGMRQAIFALQP